MSVETWKNGKRYYVERDDKGRFKLIKEIKIEPLITFEEEEIEEENYMYSVVVRVAYEGKIGHNRKGEIYGDIISSSRLSDDEIISKALEYLKGKDYWLDYVDPNKTSIVHITESSTDLSTGTYISFRDLD